MDMHHPGAVFKDLRTGTELLENSDPQPPDQSCHSRLSWPEPCRAEIKSRAADVR
jgi:hypothetical protein